MLNSERRALMTHEYRVTRKLQEQSGSWFVTLPKLWVESLGLEESDEVELIFNGIVKIIPPKRDPRRQSRRKKEPLPVAPEVKV